MGLETITVPGIQLGLVHRVPGAVYIGRFGPGIRAGRRDRRRLLFLSEGREGAAKDQEKNYQDYY
jgi:hypothetical protein